ncbi:hypothetical protein LCGC14_3061700 [marine sediment metagenome]|uniref:Uncharacterized protein n=1 Tax=marine sediment metagenome TaxID=412755 RepID=A0A0F8X6X8_9ZZZZ
MKITIKNKEKHPKIIIWQSFPCGTMIEFNDGIRAMVIENVYEQKELLLLSHWLNGGRFELARKYKTYPVAKILGTIKEIIVEK